MNRRPLSLPPARRILFALVPVLLFASGLFGREVIPPAPTQYFNDYAGIVSPGVAAQINQQLAQFERATSNQILVAIYPSMQSDSSVADYCTRVAEKWRVGQKAKDNGAVLFVFVKQHRMFIATGYGLEGALPDGLCHLIVANELVPHFKKGDYAGGLEAAVSAMIAATKGEYKGTGKTFAETHEGGGMGSWPFAIIFIAIATVISYVNQRRLRRSAIYQSGGGSPWIGPSLWLGGFGGGGGLGGGGFGGGFMGGGGGFGGGGAGGSW